MEILGCFLGFAVLIYLTYKDWSVYLATFVAACVVIFFSNLNFVDALTGTFIDGAATSLKSFFFLLLFGNIQASLYRESGAAYVIAETIMKRLIHSDSSNNRKNLMGMTIILAIGGILNLGGIIAGVVVVLMYPIALEVFELCDIPKKFILGILAAGSFTFPQSMPGSPQVGNVAAMTTLGTAADVALIPGMVGVVVEIAAILILMNLMINRARKKGEHFQRHPLDPKSTPDMPKPNFGVALIPMVLLFLAFNLLKLHIVPCLVICNLLTIGLFWNQLRGKGLKGLLSVAATESVPMTMSVSAVTGFGTIITTSEAFQTLLNALTSIDANPVIICWISIALLAFLTGGCSTCQLIGLPLIAPRLEAMGLSLSIIHRVSTFASTNLDTMPYCGSVLMLLPMSHLKLKDAYPAMFITTVLSTTIGTAAVVIVCILFPGLA